MMPRYFPHGKMHCHKRSNISIAVVCFFVAALFVNVTHAMEDINGEGKFSSLISFQKSQNVLESVSNSKLV